MNQSDIRGLVCKRPEPTVIFSVGSMCFLFVVNSAITLPIICAKRILLLIVPAPISNHLSFTFQNIWLRRLGDKKSIKQPVVFSSDTHLKWPK